MCDALEGQDRLCEGDCEAVIGGEETVPYRNIGPVQKFTLHLVAKTMAVVASIGVLFSQIRQRSSSIIHITLSHVPHCLVVHKKNHR